MTPGGQSKNGCFLGGSQGLGAAVWLNEKQCILSSVVNYI